MDIKKDVIAAIGNTPLIRLKRACELTGCEILGKAEFINPGQSVKDRAALFIIQDAIDRGRCSPAASLSKARPAIPASAWRSSPMRWAFDRHRHPRHAEPGKEGRAAPAWARELIEVPAVPYKDPNNYVKISGRLAEQLAKTEPNGAIWANQFDNVANRQAHIEGTGPEIWQQTDGRVDGFICAVGTGGTLAGVAIALKERNARNPRSPPPIRWAPRSIPGSRPAS